jgi:hypothetical protein
MIEKIVYDIDDQTLAVRKLTVCSQDPTSGFWKTSDGRPVAISLTYPTLKAANDRLYTSLIALRALVRTRLKELRKESPSL